MTMISSNLQSVHARIAGACKAAGRDVKDVTLLAVSKTFAAEAVQEAFAAGQTAFGENYVQEAVEKIQLLRHLPIQWHCVGPIQSNKTRLVAENFDWAHTVDRLKIAQRLSEQRPSHLPPLQVCIQVNIDGGPTKAGVPPEDALALAHAVAGLPRLVLRGLMCIPEPTHDFVADYAILTRARALFDHILSANSGLVASGAVVGAGNGPTPTPTPTPASASPMLDRFDTLSMGMTGDLEAAIHAGSTMVRVGTAIFGGRAKRAEQQA